MKNSFAKLLGVLAFAGSALISQAAPLSVGSSISFTSDGSTIWAGSGGTSVATYTGIATFGGVAVNNRTGSFVGFVSSGNAVTMPGSVSFANPFISNPMWQVGGFSFNLSTFSVDRYIAGVTPGYTGLFDTLVLSGKGIISGNGFDQTNGAWTWSGDALGNQAFNFSSATVALVPEGGLTISLLGLALLGLAALRRKVQS